MTTKIYLAARYSRNAEMRGVRDVLQAIGYEVTSRWIDLHTDIVGDFAASFTPEVLNERPEDCAVVARHDLDDVDRADWVVSFTGGGAKGGRHVEYGYALAKGKRCFIVGARENVFHTIPSGAVFADWPAFCRWATTEQLDRGALSFSSTTDVAL